jgi:hypothetical protein
VNTNGTGTLSMMSAAAVVVPRLTSWI